MKTENIYYVSPSFIWAAENKQTKKKIHVEIIDEEINPKDLSLFVRNKTGKTTEISYVRKTRSGEKFLNTIQ